MNITKITLDKIIPDELQPRKYFDEEKMGRLRNSIKTHGIKNPLRLEIRSDGTFLIIDGERRYRAAKELKLKEVPAILEPAQNEVQRSIEQFHLQEQTEGWTATEKAIAIGRLADQMETSVREISLLLGIPERTISTYKSFNEIIDKKNFQSSRVNLNDAARILGVRNTIKHVCEQNNIDFDRTTAKKVENAIYTRIRNGDSERNKQFFTKIKDSVMQNPNIIHEFIDNDELTVDKMFSKTKAKGAYFLRHIGLNAGYIRQSLRGFLAEKSVKVPKELIAELKQTKDAISDFISQFDE